MIVAVSGWRLWPAQWRSFVERQLLAVMNRGYLDLRVGDATGVDTVAWATRDFPQLYPWSSVTQWRATWRQEGAFNKAAGAVRNHDMLVGNFKAPCELGVAGSPATGLADMLLAFPEPGKRRSNSGTWMCIEQAHELGIPHYTPGQGQLQPVNRRQK